MDLAAKTKPHDNEDLDISLCVQVIVIQKFKILKFSVLHRSTVFR